LQYEHLSDAEKLAFNRTVAFLIFLDSLQTKNLPNISDVITLPEVDLLLKIQTFQEALHSQSYGYILESVIPAQERRAIYDIAIDNQHLLVRNQYIAGLYQDFIDNPQDILSILQVCMANFILEGLYFYTGFAFFFDLARQGKMTGVSNEISYIQRDELSHLALFKNIIQAIAADHKDAYELAKPLMRDMMVEAVKQEQEWVVYAYSEVMSANALKEYVMYLADKRMAMLGLPTIYGIKDNPLPFVERFQSLNGNKTDFFEGKVTAYAKGNVNVDDLDDIDF
jgi:ribonucleoside-diphosphate reductase beta chain